MNADFLSRFEGTAHEVASWGVSLLIQSTLIIAAGLIAAWLLQRRGAGLQSCVLRATLVAVLASPLASLALRQAGVSGFQTQFALPSSQETTPSKDPVRRNETAFVDETDASAISADSRVAEVPVALPGESASAIAERSPDPHVLSGNVGESPLESETPAQSLLNANGTTANVTRPIESTSSPLPQTGFPSLLAMLVSTWLAGAVLLVARLLVAYRKMSQICRQAVAASSTRECTELAASMNLRAPKLLISPLLKSPCLFGWLRPAILLPCGSERVSRDVLLHELSHLRRNDCCWNLLSVLTRAILWPQPLIWILVRRLEAVADEVCDDSVVAGGVDRAGYARSLLDLAEQFQTWPAGVSCGIVSVRSRLGRRVQRILDSSRETSIATSARAMAVVGLLSTTLVLGGGVFGAPPVEDAAEPPNREDDSKSSADQGDEDNTNPDALFEFSGTVTTPRGKPSAGAKVYLVHWADPLSSGTLEPVAVSKADGTFQFSRKRSDFLLNVEREPWRNCWLVAISTKSDSPEKTGLAFAYLIPFETTGQATKGVSPGQLKIWEQTSRGQRYLQLARDDVPLRGRVVDLEGQPVVGARVTVEQIWSSSTDDLSDWESAARSGEHDESSLRQLLQKHLVNGTLLGKLIAPVVSDEAGHFTLHGLGRDRLVKLQIRGPSVESAVINARTRPGSQILVTGLRGRPTETRYEGPDFVHVAAKSSLVTGTVTDIVTDQPIPDVAVSAYVRNGDASSTVRTRTDSQGRYQLEGLPIRDGNLVRVIPPTKSPYLPARQKVDTVEAEPSTLSFQLTRGQIIRGTVTDEAGTPVHGRVHYFALRSNPLAAATPGLSGSPVFRQTDARGLFEIPALPGRGLIAVSALDHERFARGLGATGIQEKRNTGNDVYFATHNSVVQANSYHRFVAIDAPLNRSDQKVTVRLKSLRQIVGTLVGPDGDHVEGAWYRGRLTNPVWRPTDEFRFQVNSLEDKSQRLLQFVHRERNLAGSHLLSDLEQGPLKVRLKSAATIRGRIVDADGVAQAGVLLESRLPRGDATFGSLPPTPGYVFGVYRTDEDGRFEVRGLAPDLKYSVSVSRPRKNAASETLGVFPRVLVLKAGETRDLGSLIPAREAAAADLQKPEREPQIDDTVYSIKGRVVDPAGKPVEGARVRAGRWFWSGFGNSVALASAKSGSDGGFTLKVRRSRLNLRHPDKLWQFVEFAATVPGFGTAWASASNLTEQALELRLVKEQPVAGRVLDLQGKPVVGARVRVHAVQVSPGGSLDPKITALQARAKGTSRRLVRPGKWNLTGKALASMLHPNVTTDKDGRFSLSGLGAERIVSVIIEGDSIATQIAYVLTRENAPTIRVLRNERYPEFGRDTFVGASFQLIAEPTRTISGVVHDAESGQPIVGARVASVKRLGQPTFDFRTLTDSQGRFQLTGLGKADVPRLTVDARNQDYPLMWKEAKPAGPEAGRLSLDFEIPKGVRVRGRVLHRRTQKPVEAYVSYFVFMANSRYQAANESGLWLQDLSSQRTRADGSFELIAFPGRGLVAARAGAQKFLQGPGAEDIAGLNQNRMFVTSPRMCVADNYHAISEIDAGGKSAGDLKLEFDPGHTLRGRVLDPDGKPLGGVVARGLREDSWGREPLASTDFQVTGLRDGEQRTLVFVHPGRKLAGTKMVLQGDDVVSVRLQRCGLVSGRLVDENGDPRAGVNLFTTRAPYGAKPERPTGSLPNLSQMLTDKDGRFRIVGLLPDHDYYLGVLERIDNANRLGRIGGAVSAKPGEEISLGDVTAEVQ